MTDRAEKPKETVFDACRNGNDARVQEYIKKGGCVTDFDEHRMTMLHHTAYAGNMSLVDAILACSPAQKLDVDAADKDSWTPLHYAADRGHAAVVVRLLDEGANVNAREDNKRAPLHLAALGGHVEVCQALTANGASKTAKNVAGMTPAECAAAAGKDAVVPFL